MKKLKMLLTVMVLLISSTAVSQIYHLKTDRLIISDGVNIETFKANLNVKLDVSTDRLTIYSEQTQIIDYEEMRSYIDEDNYNVIECTATDSDYKNIGLEVMFSRDTNHVIIAIEYSDLAYSYSCRIIR